MRLKGALQDKIFIGPKSIWIGITKRCNLACKYCLIMPFSGIINKQRKAAKEDMDFGDFTRIVDDCHALRVEQITLSGGEPFMHPKISEIINYIKQKNIGLSINTNGNFDRRFIKDLGGVSNLNINLSVLNHRQYQRLYGADKAAFNNVLENIRSIARLKKSENKKPLINVSFVINKYNFRDLDKMIPFAKKYGVDSIRFKMMRSNKNTKELAIAAGELRELKGIIKKVIKNGQYKIIKTNILEICQFLREVNLKVNCKNTDFYGLYAVDFYFDRQINDDFKCYYGWFSSGIGISGHVSLCCIRKLTFIGNVYEKSFKEIWNSKDAHKVRLGMKNDLDMKKKSWQECTYCTNVQFNNDIGNLLCGN